MARLEITVDFDKHKPTPSPEFTLRAAKSCLRLLRAVERNVTGKKRAAIPWQIDIVSSYTRCLIVLRCDGGKASEAAQTVIEEAGERNPLEVAASEPLQQREEKRQ